MPSDAPSPVSKREFFQNHIIQWLLAFSVLAQGALWGICFWFFRGREDAVLLRFNVYLGADPASLGPWYAPYGIPLLAGVFLLVQMFFSWRFFRERDRVMAHLMIFGGGIIQLSALIALVSVIVSNR